jgi:hypothetical protein
VAISEIFSSELAASGRVRSVSTEEVTRATAELKLPDSSSNTKTTPCGRRLRWVVHGYGSGG